MFFFLLSFIKEFLFKSTFTSIEINGQDNTFKMLNKYLLENNYYAGSLSSCIVKTKKEKRRWWEVEKKKKTEVEYFPAPGAHSFTYKNK